MGCAGHIAYVGVSRAVCRVLVGKHEGLKLLGRPRYQWKDIKIDLQEMGWGV
jgi:hypothetical protein